MKRFDPGAGSPHKLRRGFFAIGNYSLHKFRDPMLRNVMEAYVEEINEGERERIESMNRTLPLKTDFKPWP